MEFIVQVFNIFLHLDKFIIPLINEYGIWIYAILFFVIFAETGLVITPFLPGDSLLFVVGALAATGALSIPVLIILLCIAAIIGNQVNYHIGFHIGNKVFTWKNNRFFKQEYIQKTQEFYEKHGAKTLILSRFLPIFRTFAPFVAGVTQMNKKSFTILNIIGAVIWIIFWLVAGYFFGNIDWVKKYFTSIILGIVVVSLIPAIIPWINKHINSTKVK